MRYFFLAMLMVAAVLLVCGCAAQPERVVVTPQKVEVPVPVRCEVSYPTPPLKIDLGALAGLDVDSQVRALLLESDEYRLYSSLLLAALHRCADDINAKAARP